MQAVRRSRRGHPAPARRRKKGRPDMRAAHGRRSEAQRESQLAIARPLQETLLAEVRVTVADAGLQFLIDPYRFLPVEHVVDRKLGLKIRPAEGTLVADAQAEINDPRHATGAAARGVLEDTVAGAPGIPFLRTVRRRAVRLAQVIAVVALQIGREHVRNPVTNAHLV